MRFEDLQLKKPILDALKKAEYTSPTPIQEKAIPVALSGRDLIACAQTGTGKTAAFALPILNDLGEHDASHIRALILTPTRELAIQNFDCFKRYGRYLSLRAACIYGGAKQSQQAEQLKKGCDILIATPGRLLDFMGQGLVVLEDVEIFVLDEADRMLDMGFIGDVRRIAAHMEDRRQTLLFSATMPKEIEDLAGELLYNPVSVRVDPDMRPADTVDQYLIFLKKEDKRACLERMVKSGDVEKAIIFVRTKHGADRLKKQLVRDGINCVVIHGDRTQGQRQNALEQFRSGAVDILVATDVAARGLDIPDVSHVFNMDLPQEPENYIHRIGRTGRAGSRGVSVTLCDEDELELLRDVETLIGKNIPVLETDFSIPLVRLDPLAHGQNGSSSQSSVRSGRGKKKKADGKKAAGQRRQGRETPKRNGDNAFHTSEEPGKGAGQKKKAFASGSSKSAHGENKGKRQDVTVQRSDHREETKAFHTADHKKHAAEGSVTSPSSIHIRTTELTTLKEPHSAHDKRRYAPRMDDSRSWEEEKFKERSHGTRRKDQGNRLKDTSRGSRNRQHAGGARKRRPN